MQGPSQWEQLWDVAQGHASRLNTGTDRVGDLWSKKREPKSLTNDLWMQVCVRRKVFDGQKAATGEVSEPTMGADDGLQQLGIDLDG